MSKGITQQKSFNSKISNPKLKSRIKMHNNYECREQGQQNKDFPKLKEKREKQKSK